MNGTMKAAVMEGIGKMGYTQRPIPTPKADEVLVKLEYVGICGSDMHYYKTGAIGGYVVEPPLCPGPRVRRHCGGGGQQCGPPEGGGPGGPGAGQDLRPL